MRRPMLSGSTAKSLCRRNTMASYD